ncbi:helix-turn-helix domain-containing protein [Sphingomonas sp. RP10(2022)]|uniref:Helix-turn-helix domain-containing protein n=1 Tax=Sphingomonas liriopis TaxID=2949094 RepID=A0A9X2KQX2_9SPHN|nr:helix-turn-helix domain-containing protein [Sphingomonas liriopis]MCP3736164.1 helix-turn-helix domain-containing protein [Sphingomonas liriopis]
MSLTAGAVRMFEEICTLARLNRGRVFPSYDWLAEATGLACATIACALVLLENAGFLLRQRRFARDGAQDGGQGRPRYRQTSNAYRVLLPASARAYLPRWLRPAPLPDNHIHARSTGVRTMRRCSRRLAAANWRRFRWVARLVVCSPGWGHGSM